MGEDNGRNEKDREENKVETEISASFASIELEVSTEGKKDCKDLFDDTWQMMMESAEEMSEVTRERLGPSIER